MTDELVVEFRGWYQCRMSTDPDPTWERRGVSGYTMAYGNESDLDRVIRLDSVFIADVDYRHPRNVAPLGVEVTGVSVDGADAAHLLASGRVHLDGDPTYESWNQVVGDGVQRIAPLVVPFELRISAGDEPAALARSDPLPGGKPIWELGQDPEAYADRVPAYLRPSDEVIEELGLQPGDLSQTSRSPWFEQRCEWLRRQSAPEGSVERVVLEAREAMIAEYSSPRRKFFLDNRLALQAVWDHPVRGPDAQVGSVVEKGLWADFSRKVDRRSPWHVRYWHGGWDGDLMRGLMKGDLRVPLLAV